MFNEPFSIVLTILAIYILVQLRKIKNGLGDLNRLEDRLLEIQRELRHTTKPLEKPAIIAEKVSPQPPPIPISLLNNTQSPQDGSAGTPRPTEMQEISQGGAKPSSLRSPSGGVGPAEPRQYRVFR